MNHSTVNQKEFIFRDKCECHNISEKIAFSISDFLYKVNSLIWWSTGFSPYSQILVKRKRLVTSLLFSPPVSLKDIALYLGIENSTVLETLEYHQKQESLFVTMNFVIYALFLFIYYVPFLIYYNQISSRIGGVVIVTLFGENIDFIQLIIILVWTAFLVLTGGFIAIFLSAITMRTIGGILNQFFAESHCLREIMYISVDLHRYESLPQTRVRVHLFKRIERLANMTLMIPCGYQMIDVEQTWMYTHFLNLSLYIKERGRWLTAPHHDTLSILRQDFDRLLEIYITGQYGEFQWDEHCWHYTNDRRLPKHSFLRVIYQIIRVLVPIAIIASYFIYIQSEQNIDAKYLGQITIIFISWLLIYIDISLKLGVTEGLLNLIKNIKG